MLSRFITRPGLVTSALLIGVAINLLLWQRWQTRTPAGSIETLSQFEHIPNGNEGVFRFTPPTKIARLATDWEKQRALVIGLSFPEITTATDLTQYQIDLLAIAHKYVEIYIFCEHDYSRAYSFFLASINKHPEAEAILAKTHFIDSRSLHRWTRDYGPIFGMKADKGLVVLDPVYRDLSRDLKELINKVGDSERKLETLQGDAMPADVAAFLQQRFDADVEVVRPPLMIDGGDFVHDGRGNVFISTQTLVRNGSNKATLEELFRQYFGTKKLHVLESLPGTTVNHLDMIFKFVDSQTVILPDYQLNGEEQLNRYRKELTRGVQNVLTANENYMRKHFPDVRILKLPMPPIMFMSYEEILAEARSEFLHMMALNRGLLSIEEINKLPPPDRPKLEERTLELIRSEMGWVDFSTAAGFNIVLKNYGQLPLDTYFDIHSETITRYRSYINSLFLHDTNGKQVYIVPQFTARNSTEANLIHTWETQVEKTYLQAHPQASIRWINCDPMVNDSGFIHCTTITVPAWEL
jgi:agmatine/peptidylarginine deiminase